MFVAGRGFRFARSRFVLIGMVVALITVLVGFLSGLTGGLAEQNISAITADRIVFSHSVTDASPSYSDSAVTSAQAAVWRAEPGVRAVSPLGISQLKIHAGSRQASVAVFGADHGFDARPPGQAGRVTLPGTVAATLEVRTGESVSRGGSTHLVDSVTADTWHSHTAVVWMTLQDWQTLAVATGTSSSFATVFAITAIATNFAAADAAAGTSSTSVLSYLTALRHVMSNQHEDRVPLREVALNVSIGQITSTMLRTSVPFSSRAGRGDKRPSTIV